MDELNLNKILKEKKMFAKELSEQTGINYGTMLKYSSGERNITVKAAKKIGKALEIPWWTLFENEELTTCDLVELLNRRTGVEKVTVEPNTKKDITVEGPAIVLIVTD